GVEADTLLRRGKMAPVGEVHRRIDPPVDLADWRHLSPAEQRVSLDSLLREDRRQGFDPAAAPLMRIRLIRLADEVHQLVWTHHHLLFDGWSRPVLLGEALELYEAARERGEANLPAVRPYRDYIGWLQRQDRDAARRFWQEYLRGFSTTTPLALSGTVGEPAGERSAIEWLHLSPEDSRALQWKLRQEHLTLNTFFQGLWALELAHLSGLRDVVFGTVVSGRPAELEGIETSVGLFINTLPMRVRLATGDRFWSWLDRLQLAHAELRQYEATPLVEIQGWSEVPRGLPLFESLLVFENFPADVSLQARRSLRFRDLDHALIESNYPVMAGSGPGESISLRVFHDLRRASTSHVRHLLADIAVLAGRVLAGPEVSLAELLAELARAAEERRALQARDAARAGRDWLSQIARRKAGQDSR
ncbi:MAG TPA: condensation domain-containing protein, partial [Thermoanaerobaculia bacterium]|nr:condensation domain-containing protein [Thermoanaerobaculia bacterium]